MKLRNVRRVRTALVGTTVVSVAALALSGCGAGGSSSSTEGDDLTVLVEGGGLAELQPIADLYEKETGTTVKLLELPANFQTQFGLAWGPMTALAAMYSVPVILLTLVLQRHIVAGLTLGAVKG